jgi:hypothetical protein
VSLYKKEIKASIPEGCVVSALFAPCLAHSKGWIDVRFFFFILRASCLLGRHSYHLSNASSLFAFSYFSNMVLVYVQAGQDSNLLFMLPA